MKLKDKANIIKQTLSALNYYNVSDVTVSWIKTNERIYGRACYQRRYIHYNESLLRQDKGEIIFTILHEVSHIIANKLYGYNCSHNNNWETIARAIHNKPEVLNY